MIFSDRVVDAITHPQPLETPNFKAIWTQPVPAQHHNIEEESGYEARLGNSEVINQKAIQVRY